MKKYINYLSILLFISSCQIIGLTSDYKKISETEKSYIKELDSFENTEGNNVYIINGKQLKEELKNNKKSIVYTFANGCSSENCLPLAYYENFAKENNYKLYMVMSGYYDLYKTLDQESTSPLYAIDDKYYNTKYSGKYLRMFENEISGKPLDEKRTSYNSFYFFEKDTLVKSTTKITD